MKKNGFIFIILLAAIILINCLLIGCAEKTRGRGKASLPDFKINPIDMGSMILIPGGEYMLGSDEGEPLADEDEMPGRSIRIDPFYIYKFEVTNGQYERFADATGYRAQGEWLLFFNEYTLDHPVCEVSYNDALAYCRWAGGRLPTEAEWEAACRGNDRRIYPWGDQWDPEKCNNMEMTSLREDVAKLENQKGIWYGTLPVGSFPEGASPFGVMDMAGNVGEWCMDYYDEDYYRIRPEHNPPGPSHGEDRIIRGGSFIEQRAEMRCASRDDDEPEKWCNMYGFRVVLPVEE